MKRGLGFILKILFAAGFIYVFLLLLFNGGQRYQVYDNAQLFDSEQKQELEAALKEAGNALQCDLIAVTEDNMEGKTPEEYADSFYVTENRGFEGKKGTGVLLLFDMETRNILIYTSGRAYIEVTDAESGENNETEQVLDDIWPSITSGDYAGAVLTFAQRMKEEYFVNDTRRAGIEGIYDTENKEYRFWKTEEGMPEDLAAAAKESSAAAEAGEAPEGADVRMRRNAVVIAGAIVSYFVAWFLLGKLLVPSDRSKLTNKLGRYYLTGRPVMEKQEDVYSYTSQEVVRRVEKRAQTYAGSDYEEDDYEEELPPPPPRSFFRTEPRPPRRHEHRPSGVRTGGLRPASSRPLDTGQPSRRPAASVSPEPSSRPAPKPAKKPSSGSGSHRSPSQNTHGGGQRGF